MTQSNLSRIKFIFQKIKTGLDTKKIIVPLTY